MTNLLQCANITTGGGGGTGNGTGGNNTTNCTIGQDQSAQEDCLKTRVSLGTFIGVVVALLVILISCVLVGLYLYRKKRIQFEGEIRKLEKFYEKTYMETNYVKKNGALGDISQRQILEKNESYQMITPLKKSNLMDANSAQNTFYGKVVPE